MPIEKKNAFALIASIIYADLSASIAVNGQMCRNNVDCVNWHQNYCNAFRVLQNPSLGLLSAFSVPAVRLFDEKLIRACVFDIVVVVAVRATQAFISQHNRSRQCQIQTGMPSSVNGNHHRFVVDRPVLLLSAHQNDPRFAMCVVHAS